MFSDVMNVPKTMGIMTASYPEIVLAACILILPFLYESSHVFRYNLKFFLYYFLVMVNCVILIPVFVFRPRNVKNLVLASHFCRFISTLIGLRWILKGREHLAKEQACIMVCNHQSSIDILGMFDMWPIMGKCTVVAKKELLYTGPFGLASWLAGLVFIPRGPTHHREKAKHVMNEAVEKILRNKTKLWIFPEGTRRNTGQIHPFKKGAFHLAITAQLPILPVVFSRYYFLDKSMQRFDHGKIMVTALPPIETKGMRIEEMEDLMKKVRDMMTSTYHESSKEVMDSMQPISSHKNA